MIENDTIKSKELKEEKSESKENYKSIKPETKHTDNEVNDFWKNELNKNKDINTSNNNEQNNLDDNGKVYRESDRLLPNTTYDINGYRYKTDENGRIVEASGKLKLRDPDYKRNMEDVRHKEGQDYRITDDQGHLIGHQFGGSDKLGNMVPMDANLNKGDYRKLENTLANELRDGKDVRIKVEPVYESNSNRPSEFKITYIVNNEKEVIVFKNGGKS